MSKPRRFHRDIDGILLLDKPLGVSSNAALQQVRVLFGAAKAGHAGSLDPLASGMLPVCLGQATKVCGRLLNSGKTYRVVAQLGARTESGDCETGIVERAPVPPLTEASVDAVLAKFVGEQQQIPPMHSALKFEGKRLYELARRGESVDRPARPIVIHRLQRIALSGERLEFDVYCSKGTYIRTLAADIAQALGTLGYVEGLRRLSIDPFEASGMHTMEELERRAADRDSLLLAPDVAFAELPGIELDQPAERSLLQGQAVSASRQVTPNELKGELRGELRAYGQSGRFLGIVAGQEDGRVRPVRLFVTVEAPSGGPARP